MITIAQPSTVFMAGDRPAITLRPDGTIEFHDGITPDDAARAFMEAVKHVNPAHATITSLRHEVERLKADLALLGPVCIRVHGPDDPKDWTKPNDGYTRIYLMAGRKVWHPKLPPGWEETHWERYDYIECGIYRKRTDELTVVDHRDWVAYYSKRPQGWLEPTRVGPKAEDRYVTVHTADKHKGHCKIYYLGGSCTCGYFYADRQEVAARQDMSKPDDCNGIGHCGDLACAGGCRLRPARPIMKGHTAGPLPLSDGGRGIDEDTLRLFTAAPLLLEALKEAREEIVDMLGDMCLGSLDIANRDIIRSIDSAIAAATRSET